MTTKCFSIALILTIILLGVILSFEYTIELEASPDPLVYDLDETGGEWIDYVGVREITGYTLGREEETDDTPCIGAYGHDLCELARQGVQVCASNEFPAFTKLYIGNIECEILDRMNRRYKNRIDLAFLTHAEALEFGLKELIVSQVK